MGLEDKIKELQRQLEVKQAYSLVKISFGREGRGISEEVKTEVTNKLNEIALKLAEDQEILKEESTTFSNEEVTILKQIVNKIVSPSEKTIVKKNDTEIPMDKEISEKAEPIKGRKARIMLLDNVDITMRKKIEPESEVMVMDTRDDLAFVQDKKANRFFVPIDDLDFNL